MKKIFNFIILSAFIFLILLISAGTVFAHGGEPRLEIGRQMLAPGEVLDIRGVDFESEASITLTLRGSQAEIPMGEILGDVEGGFILNFSLPANLAEGTYTVRARSADHEVDSPPFKVQGMAAQEGGDQPVGENDMLLAPMPTLPSGYSSTPMPQSENSAAPRTPTAGNRAFLFPAAGVLVIVLSLIAARLIAHAKRK